MEIFDIVDREGRPTGQTVEREKAHTEGIRHRTAHIWIVRKEQGRWEILLQKRSLEKDSFPGRWDTSSAGHIQAGDEPEESAVREVGEELGLQICAADLVPIGTFDIDYTAEFHHRFWHDNEIAFVYLLPVPVDVRTLKLQKEEVEEAAWFGLDEVMEGTRRADVNFCVCMDSLELLKKYLNNAA